MKKLLDVPLGLLLLATPTVLILLILFPFIAVGLLIVAHYINKDDPTDIESAAAFFSMITLIAINSYMIVLFF